MTVWHEEQRRIIDALPPLNDEQCRELTRITVEHRRRK